MGTKFSLNEHVEDIEIHGLRGRMAKVGATNKKATNLEILFVHGHHSSIERMNGVIELLAEYGNITLPDLPGFGGMDSLYRVGEKPTTDNLADYMAAFIKLRYGNKKKFVLIGYSMGFMVVTRMLQKYPDLQKQVIDVVAVAGIVHHDNFTFSKKRMRGYKLAAKIFQNPFMAWVAHEFFMRKWFIGSIYARSRNAKVKFSGLNTAEFKHMVDFEVTLWRCNDVRTRFKTLEEMFYCDLVNNAPKIPLNLYAVMIGEDQYFDGKVCEQHFKIIYDKVKVAHVDLSKHGVSVVGSADDARPFFPTAFRKYLVSLQ